MGRVILLLQFFLLGAFLLACAPRSAPLEKLSPPQTSIQYQAPGMAEWEKIATKIFVNWLLDREGQEIWSRTTVAQTARVDVDVDFLLKRGKAVRQPGISYFMADEESELLRTPEMANMIKNIFEPLTK